MLYTNPVFIVVVSVAVVISLAVLFWQVASLMKTVKDNDEYAGR